MRKFNRIHPLLCKSTLISGFGDWWCSIFAPKSVTMHNMRANSVNISHKIGHLDQIVLFKNFSDQIDLIETTATKMTQGPNFKGLFCN